MNKKKYPELLQYKDVTIRKVEPDRIRIMHKTGFATIYIEELPPEVVKELGMTLKDVDGYREEVKQKKLALRKKHKEKLEKIKKIKNSELIIINATVTGIEDDGVIIYIQEIWDGKSYYYKTTRPMVSSLGRVGGGRGYATSYKVRKTVKVKDSSALVICNPNKYRVGTSFRGKVWKVGSFYRDDKKLLKFTIKYRGSKIFDPKAK